MTTLLHLDTSIFSASGQSSQLAAQFVAELEAADPGLRVVRRDLASDPVPHLTAERFGAFLAKPDERTAEQHEIATYSDALIDELKAAKTIVLGLPMYNFGVPSQLKAYFDHVARAGITFKYTDAGADGLLTGKRAYVFAARGGLYKGTPNDTQTSYVRSFLGFLGIRDVQFVYAEGLAIGDAQKASAVADAQSVLQQLAQAESLAA